MAATAIVHSRVGDDDAWLAAIRASVEARLATVFAERRARIARYAVEGFELVDALAALTLRGGKRVRPALLAATFEAVAPRRDLDAVWDAGAALELLQSYLLIHDDWMDGDDVRRGGPAVHASFAARHGARRGAALGILAGNLASAWAWAQLGPSPAWEVFLAMHREVVVGQQLDLLGARDVSRMHRLKTGSYTARGPVALGAALGDAPPDARAALARFAAPLGEAFQLCDDLLGTFGDPARTGKPVAGDLAAGRWTSLRAEAERRASAIERAAIDAVASGASDPASIARARRALESCGARGAVEDRLDALLADALAALSDAPLDPAGVDRLVALATRLVRRAS